jgi:hypothetical protein
MRVHAALLTIVLGASACGPTCQESCNRLYAPEPDACDISVPGRTVEEVTRLCVDSCEDALKQTGELGDYDPNRRRASDSTVALENELQAAEWMDCVEATTCELLDPRTGGYCAPVTF